MLRGWHFHVFSVWLGYCFYFLLCIIVHNILDCSINWLCMLYTNHLPQDYLQSESNRSKDWWECMCQPSDCHQVSSNLLVDMPEGSPVKKVFKSSTVVLCHVLLYYQSICFHHQSYLCTNTLHNLHWTVRREQKMLLYLTLMVITCVVWRQVLLVCSNSQW